VKSVQYLVSQGWHIDLEEVPVIEGLSAIKDEIVSGVNPPQTGKSD
jgi:hypothetical protein